MVDHAPLGGEGHAGGVSSDIFDLSKMSVECPNWKLVIENLP
jgi:hypothetical protein